MDNEPRLKLIKSEVNQTELAEFDTIRAELNLDQWIGIWQPAKLKGSSKNPKTIILEETEIREDGSKAVAQVEVNATVKYGNLTTEDQKVWYALIFLWEIKGRPIELQFSLREIASILGKLWHQDSLEAIKKSLTRLGVTGFVWKNAFYHRPTQETIRELKTLHILTELHIAGKESDGHTTKQACRAKFHPLIDANLRANHTKPTVLKTVVGFKSGIALMLYKHLELKMYKQKSYHRLSKELFFEDLGIDGERYKKPSFRKKILVSVLKELDGVPIAHGQEVFELKVWLKAARNGNDYILYAEKTKQVDVPLESKTTVLPPVPTEPGFKPAPRASVTNRTAPVSVPATIRQQAIELVQYFHQKFFNLEGVEPGDQELAEATRLIQKHGGEVARLVVDYAFKKAPESGFRIAVFKGVVGYAGRAAAHSRQQVEAQAQVRQAAAAQARAAACPYCQGRGLLTVMRLRHGQERLCHDGPPCKHDPDEIRSDAEQYRLKIVLPDGTSFDFRERESEE